jgi:hypothetical protein
VRVLVVSIKPYAVYLMGVIYDLYQDTITINMLRVFFLADEKSNVFKLITTVEHIKDPKLNVSFKEMKYKE